MVSWLIVRSFVIQNLGLQVSGFSGIVHHQKIQKKSKFFIQVLDFFISFFMKFFVNKSMFLPRKKPRNPKQSKEMTVDEMMMMKINQACDYFWHGFAITNSKSTWYCLSLTKILFHTARHENCSPTPRPFQ